MTYAKNWAEIAERAKDFIEFLQGHNFYSKPYITDKNYLVITDVELAIHYATDSSWETFTDWETVTDSFEIFPESFEWNSKVNFQLNKLNYFDIETRCNFNGADKKWDLEEVNPMIELMLRDIQIIFQCFSNNYFPPIWQNILQVYYDGGFPCGWSRLYPEGKMVVFSNF